MEQEILEYVLINTPTVVFNNIWNTTGLQGLYDRHKNYLVHKYFDGDILKCSIKLRSIFDQFMTSKQEEEARRLLSVITQGKLNISRMRRFRNHESADKIAERINVLVSQYNELVAGFERMRKLTNKLQKSIRRN